MHTLSGSIKCLKSSKESLTTKVTQFKTQPDWTESDLHNSRRVVNAELVSRLVSFQFLDPFMRSQNKGAELGYHERAKSWTWIRCYMHLHCSYCLIVFWGL